MAQSVIGAFDTRQAGEAGTKAMKRDAVALLFLAAVVIVIADQAMGRTFKPAPSAYGWITLALFYAVSAVVEGSVYPFRAAVGKDGRLSASKFQLWIWTAVIASTYTWLYAVRLQHHVPGIIDSIPANVLIVMGVSVTTATAAKAITSSFVANGAVQKPQNPGDASTADLVTGDSDSADLVKIQMLLWTLIAVGVYLVQAYAAAKQYATCTLPCKNLEFPNIDTSLVVFMGLGHAAYVGGKLVSVETPRLGLPTPQMGGWGTEVTVTGQALGDSQGTSWLTINDRPVPAKSWSAQAVTLEIPRRRPSDGGDWRFNEQLLIGVLVAGSQSANTVPFQIATPRIQRVYRADASATPPSITIQGSGFGARQDDSQVVIDGYPVHVNVTRWEDGAVVFELPGKHPDGTDMKQGRAIGVRVRIYGQDCPDELRLTV